MRPIVKFMLMQGSGLPPAQIFNNYVTSLSGLIVTWPFQDAAAASVAVASPTSMNGTNSNVTTGVASGKPAFPLCYTYNGLSSKTDIFSAAFAAAFNGPAGTLSYLAKVSGAGIWTDGVNHPVFYLSDSAGFGNALISGKSVADNLLDGRYFAGGTLSQRLPSIGLTAGINWYMITTTWDKAADQYQDYLNGIAVGAVTTGLGTWAAQPITNRIVIGAGTTFSAPTLFWSGNLAYPTIYNRALTPAEILQMAQLAGVA